MGPEEDFNLQQDHLAAWMVLGAGGRPLRVVTAVDGPAFQEAWLDAVERASALSRP